MKKYNLKEKIWEKPARNIHSQMTTEISEEDYLKELKRKYPRTGPYYYAGTNKIGDL